MIETTTAGKAIPLPSWRSTARELTGLLALPRLGLELRRQTVEPSPGRLGYDAARSVPDLDVALKADLSRQANVENGQ